MFTTINPATKTAIGEYQLFDFQQAKEVVEKSQHAYASWSDKPLSERIGQVKSLAGTLRQYSSEWAELITLETGKPITESLAEIEKCAWNCEVYAENVQNWLNDESAEVDGKVHKVVYQPLGVILAIMPWNYPFWQVFRFAIPTLLSGNTALLRHSNSVPLCAMAIEKAFQVAGFPADVFRTLVVDNDVTGKIIESEAVRGVAFTGSTEVGAKIAEQAARKLKKVVLELGGSDPFIVLEDANIEAAAVNAVKGRFGNCGQSCVSSKRFIVDKKIAKEFQAKFVEEVNKLVVGDPRDPATDIGPMISSSALSKIEAQFNDAIEKGGEALTGGVSENKKGYFFNPAVVSNTTNAMKIVSEETFGPLAPIIVVRGESEAIRVANDTEFGLGGSVWTQDLLRGEKVALKIDAGTVFVNSITKSDPRMPFGGTKKSGMGRELSKYGLMEFVNIKGVNVYDLD